MTTQLDSATPAAYFATLRRIVSEIGPQGTMQNGLKALLRILCENHGYKRALLTIFDPETNSLKLSVTFGCLTLTIVKAHAMPARALRFAVSSGGSWSATSHGERPGSMYIGEKYIDRPAPCQKNSAASTSSARSWSATTFTSDGYQVWVTRPSDSNAAPS